MKFDMVLEQFELNILRLNETREITAVVLTVSKNFNIDMYLDIYESIWFKLAMMIDTVKLYIFDTSLTDHDLESRSQECKKENVLLQLRHKDFNCFGWNLYTVETCWCNDDDNNSNNDRNNNNNNNNNNNERISRVPLHEKHAQLRWTGANTKIQNTCI